MSRKLTTEEFIEKARSVHGSLYSYDKTVYSGAQNKIVIGCSVHGDVEISADAHGNQQQGCGKCRGNKISLTKRSSLTEFIAKAKEVHGERFDYSKVEYTNHHTKVKIDCPVHGTFLQRPNDHLHQSQGCPRCMRCGFNISKPGSLYVLNRDNWLKVGITNRSVSIRAKEIYKSSGYHFEVVATFKFDNGEEALRVETLLLNQLRQEYNNPEEVFNGSTETFVDLPLEVALKKIAEAISSNSQE